MKHKLSRQKRLLDILTTRNEPMSGAELAERCKVTRQVVVHDIALLRASGVSILSTPRGYLLQTQDDEQQLKEYVLSMNHPPELTAVELRTFVDYGIRVKDVIIEHPLYGELRGSLNLASRRDVDLFLQKVNDTTEDALLSKLTSGFHLHTVEYQTITHLQEAIQELRRLGIQVLDE